jgi:hypothetical protein
MSVDISAETLHSGTTITGSTSITPHNRNYMDGFCMVAEVASVNSISGAYFVLQGSVDGSTYVSLADTTATVSAAGNILWNYDAPFFSHVRPAFTAAAGNIVATIKVRSIGD